MLYLVCLNGNSSWHGHHLYHRTILFSTGSNATVRFAHSHPSLRLLHLVRNDYAFYGQMKLLLNDSISLATRQHLKIGHIPAVSCRTHIWGMARIPALAETIPVPARELSRIVHT